jgi:hypothetical protein
LCLGIFLKEAYMANHIPRMGALNCFEELTSINWHLNVVILYRLILRCKPKKKRKKVSPINEIVEIGALNCFQKLP